MIWLWSILVLIACRVCCVVVSSGLLWDSYALVWLSAFNVLDSGFVNSVVHYDYCFCLYGCSLFIF